MEMITPIALEEESNNPAVASMINLPWQDILDKMDGEEDAFLRMKIVLYELMPAITTWKEDSLKDLAVRFENSVDLVEELDHIQEMFNDIKQSRDQGEVIELGEKLHKALQDMETRIELEVEEGRMNPDLGRQIAETFKGMWEGIDQAAIDYGLSKGEAIAIMWYHPDAHHADEATELGWIEHLKTQIDGYHDAGAGLSGHSAALEAELQFEIGNVQQFYGIQNGMYEQDIAANRNHINKLGAH